MSEYTCPVCGTTGGDTERLMAPRGWLWVLEAGSEPYGHGVRYCSPACLVTAFDGRPDAGETADGPVLTAYLRRNGPLFEAHTRLHIPAGSLVVDMTYGRGGFWSAPGTAERYRLVRIDRAVNANIRPDVQADLTRLPLRDGCADALVLDPPYANNGGPHHGEDGVHVTYNLTPGLSTAQIHRLYRAGISEAARVLRRGGVLMVKCQDGVESGRRRWTSHLVLEWAEAAGFEAIDQGVLVNPQPPRMRHQVQYHARTNHSFLWTLRYVGQGQLGLQEAT